MIETPGQKSEREAIERQEREDDQQRWEREKYQVKQGIEKLTRKRIDKIIFDTETHEWDINTSEFGNIVEGRKDIVVMIEDERKNLFGGYIGETVQLCKAVKTDKCFVYSLRKNGIFNPKRYDVKRGETRYFLNQQNNPLAEYDNKIDILHQQKAVVDKIYYRYFFVLDIVIIKGEEDLL